MRLSGQKVPFASEPLAHRPFEANAKQYPERVALTCGPTVYTYAELNVEANQLAHYLASRGIGEGAIVGVSLDRSPELMVSILGILKAGAGYLPLDVTYPAERLRVMMSQLANIRLVLTSPDTTGLVRDGHVELLDVEQLKPALGALPSNNLSVKISDETVCYVVFTSGSTGTPKATAVRHRGWFNLLNWLKTGFQLGSRSSNLMVSSFGFDISQRSLMTPLFTGAALHLLPSRNFDGLMANRLIKELGVRTLHCAPSTLYLILERDIAEEADGLASLDFVFVGGEPLSAGRVADWATKPSTGAKLVNVYGVAECTDVSSFHVLADYPRYVAGGVPIGKPIHNIDIHIVDSDLAPVEAGNVGEICISGVGVGAGYLNSGTLNEERFIKIRFAGDLVELYRTGDLGYVGPDGALMCVGRVDAQVKVRGMRIDLGDVETAIRANKRVHDATVLALRSNDSQEADLVAFVVPSGNGSRGALDHAALRVELHSVLPKNMVPKEFFSVLGFPLSPNGKIDREALAQSARRS